MSNKDEALRAKDLAEDWMRKEDFTTARRVALKAQKMDATLENVVARMIMVCDVQCTILEKSGDEIDWYKILQVDQNADENTIKRQYKKLALHLHPDKNKLPGAESAFKTIVDAQSVLLDKDKRRGHDMRRKPFKRPAPAAAPVPSYRPKKAPPPSYYTPSVFQPNVNTTRNSFTTGLRPEYQPNPQSQSTESSGGKSFWTSCPLCRRMYEHERKFINKLMTCLSCCKPFVAFRTTFQGPPFQATFSFSQQSKVPTQKAGKAAIPQQSKFPTKEAGKAAIPQQSKFPTQEASKAAIPQHSKVPTQKAGKAAKKQPENSARTSPRKEGSRAKSSRTASESSNGKRKRKMIYESSDSSSSESSNKCEEFATVGQDSGSTNGLHSRRSVRKKQQISYKENLSDDDNKEEDEECAEESDLRNKSHENPLFAETLPNGINKTEKVKEDQVGSSRNSGAINAAKNSGSGTASDKEIFECADSDFTNFEKSREEMCFKAGQIWAMYDVHGMPRYYAIIRKVIRKPSFILKITWLEADPDDEKAKQWVHKNLPISVGKFEVGGTEDTNKTPSFSHLIHCRVGSKKDTLSVYPRVGETWALFKNWDIKWSSGRGSTSHEFEYEFGVILSEYAEGVAIEVAFLRKVKGFASIFCRIAAGGGSDTVHIPPHEFLRFSHSIPSTKLTGKEGNGVPVGSYELDTAALPQKIEEPEEAVPVPQETAKPNQVRPQPSSEPDCVVIPSFHDFSAKRSEGKFSIGQIWSLNCKEDGLPKYYAQIQKIIYMPNFKLGIKRLKPEALPENVIQWRDKEMPVSVGNFTLKEGQVETVTNVNGFSHQIKAKQWRRGNEYTVFPKTGEIWAIYKDWSETIKISSLKSCEYEVVEVLDDNERHIEVMMLQRVDGFITVFKEKVEGGINMRNKIPRCELFRFSHYVPAFRLTGQRNGALRGCVELDSTALSRNLLRS